MMPRSTGWVNSHPFEPTTRHPTYLCGVGGEMVAATVLAHGSGQSRAEIEKRDSSWLRYGTVHRHEYREAAARRQCRRSNLSPRQSLICTVLYQLGKGGFFFSTGSQVNLEDMVVLVQVSRGCDSLARFHQHAWVSS